MKPFDFCDRVLLLLSTHTNWTANAEISFDQWNKIRREFYELLAQAGNEAMCAHQTLEASGICLKCGRKPNERNTLI